MHIAVEQNKNEQNKKRLNKRSVTIYNSAYATSCFHLEPPSGLYNITYRQVKCNTERLLSVEALQLL